MTNDAMEGRISVESVFERRLELIEPRREDLAAVGRKYVETVEPTARATIAALAARGWTPVIVSGGFTQAIQPLADYLGVARIEAVELKFTADGTYDGFDEAAPTSRSGGKAEVIRKLKQEYRPEKVVMVGDGASDLEAAPDVDLFVGFGRYITRANVKSGRPGVCTIARRASRHPMTAVPQAPFPIPLDSYHDAPGASLYAYPWLGRVQVDPFNLVAAIYLSPWPSCIRFMAGADPPLVPCGGGTCIRAWLAEAERTNSLEARQAAGRREFLCASAPLLRRDRGHLWHLGGGADRCHGGLQGSGHEQALPRGDGELHGAHVCRRGDGHCGNPPGGAPGGADDARRGLAGAGFPRGLVAFHSHHRTYPRFLYHRTRSDDHRRIAAGEALLRAEAGFRPQVCDNWAAVREHIGGRHVHAFCRSAGADNWLRPGNGTCSWWKTSAGRPG